ncbi:hypothetical protein GEMRC1_011054 [Eukaryota sp. GEM-RC1]
MGNYDIMGTFWIGCFAAFRRGVLIEGTGDLVVLENQHATFAGNFILEGNVQVMEMGSFDFLERATVRFFYSNYVEHGATIDWHSASRLQLQDLAVSITNGTYTVQSGAEWRPVTAFRGSLNLSGDSVFHFEPSIGVVDFDVVSVYENALLLLDSDQLFTVNSLQLGDGVSLQLPFISGSDDLFGVLENNIEISSTATATVGQFSLQNNVTLGPDTTFTVHGKLIIDGTLSLLTKSNLKLHSLVTITSQLPLLLWPESQTLFSTTSSLTLSSTINSTISTSKHLPSFLSFQGSTVLKSPLIIDTFVNSLFGSGSSFNVYDSFLQIDSANDPVINGTFTLFNDSFITCTNNVITFVAGSLIQGTGRLYPVELTILRPHIYKPLGSLIFEKAFITDLSSIDATIGNLSFKNCLFGGQEPDLISVSLQSVETVFYIIAPIININTVTISGGVVILYNTSLNVYGGGFFDSDIYLCDTCIIGLFNENYVFSPTSILGTMNNLGGTLNVSHGSSVLFEGLYLLNPDVEIGSGHLHFMKGSVFNVTSIFVQSNGSLNFSQCPDSGEFNLSHVHVEGEVDFNSQNCGIFIESLYVNDGALNFGDVAGSVTIKSSTIIDTQVNFLTELVLTGDLSFDHCEVVFVSDKLYSLPTSSILLRINRSYLGTMFHLHLIVQHVK